VEIANQERMATINGLTPNRTYTISVLAYSEMGQGPLSVPSQVITRQGGMYQLLFFVSITEFSGVSFSQGFFSSLKSSQEFCIFSLSYLDILSHNQLGLSCFVTELYGLPYFIAVYSEVG